MLNHSRTIKIVISLLCICCMVQYFKHSRDKTILIVLLWFSIIHYSSFFPYFFIDLLLSLLLSKFLLYLLVENMVVTAGADMGAGLSALIQ